MVQADQDYNMKPESFSEVDQTRWVFFVCLFFFLFCFCFLASIDFYKYGSVFVIVAKLISGSWRL